jgi:hypothetical protein
MARGVVFERSLVSAMKLGASFDGKRGEGARSEQPSERLF